MGPQVTMQPELVFMNYVLSDPISHKAEHDNTQSSHGSGIYVIRPQKTLKAQVSYMKWPKCSWSSLLVHCFLLPALHPWLHGECPTISWQRKRRTWARFTNVSTPKWTTLAPNPLWDIPERLWWREIAPVGKTLGSASNYALLLRRKVDQMCNYYILIYELQPLVWLDGWGLRSNMIGKLVTKKFGEEICG